MISDTPVSDLSGKMEYFFKSSKIYDKHNIEYVIHNYKFEQTQCRLNFFRVVFLIFSLENFEEMSKKDNKMKRLAAFYNRFFYDRIYVRSKAKFVRSSSQNLCVHVQATMRSKPSMPRLSIVQKCVCPDFRAFMSRPIASFSHINFTRRFYNVFI